MKIRTAALVLSLFGVVACKGEEKKQEPPKPAVQPAEPAKPAEPAPTAQVDLEKAKKAARLANEIQKTPDKAEDILKQEGMTPEQFETMLYEVAEDPMLAETYAKERTPQATAEAGTPAAGEPDKKG